MVYQNIFEITWGVKQGYPWSHMYTLGLCINKLEVENRVAREEGLDAPKLIQQVILLFLYTDNMVIFSYDVDGMQCLLGALEAFSGNNVLKNKGGSPKKS